MIPTDAARVAEIDFTPIELRVLAYLDQRGPTHRSHVVCDLAGESSRIAFRRRANGRTFLNGSNGAAPLIMGRWCSRLGKVGLIRIERSARGYYHHHEITPAGRTALRAHLQSRSREKPE